jgi:CxxC motif-containing protein (DUF1111 family)
MKPYQPIALALSLALAAPSAIYQARYSVTYSGGSLPGVKPGQGMHLFLDADKIRLLHGDFEALNLKAASITEVSYGQEVHNRVGTGAALAVVSLGIGLIVAFSKSKKHYIGVVWAEGDQKGGLVLQADKNEFRGILAGLEGLTGKKAVNTDPPKKDKWDW